MGTNGIIIDISKSVPSRAIIQFVYARIICIHGYDAYSARNRQLRTDARDSDFAKSRA